MNIGRLMRPALVAVLPFAAVLVAVIEVLSRAETGDVGIYRAAGRAAVSTGAVYGFRFGGHGFTYPPFAALVFGTIAWLPTALMWTTMVALSLAALVRVVRLSAPALMARLNRGDLPAAAGVCVFVLCQPVVATLRYGQVNLLLMAMVLTDLLLLRRGVLLGLATAIKLTPGVFVLLLLLQGRMREAAAATAAFAATVLLGWCVLPAASTTYWTHDVVTGSGIGGFATPGNQSIRGLADILLGPSTGTTVSFALAVPVLVAGLALATRAARAGQEVLAIGLVGITGCLVSPMSWTHHWVWFIPALAGLWASPTSRNSRQVTAAVAAIITGWTFLTPHWVEGHRLANILGTGYLPLAALIATAAWQSARRPQTDTITDTPSIPQVSDQPRR